MPTFTIRSREHGEVTFFLPTKGGDVYLEYADHPGTLGRKICRGGDFLGNPLSATLGTFEAVCRRWHRQRLQACREYGGRYGN